MADSLTISQAPGAFVELAQKHNDLVALIKAIRGGAGIKVTITDSNIVIEQDRTTASSSLSGYSDRAISVCVAGVLQSVTFLVRT